MTVAVSTLHEELIQNGFTLIHDVYSDDEAAEALGRFGVLIPQYDGALRYQVKAAPGFEKRRFSKSTNTIPVHTEAPGWDPPPRFLALHCRVQAACGSGHTGLADAAGFLRQLDGQDRGAAYSHVIDWLGENISGTGGQGVRRPIVERAADGHDIIRFSYNLLTAGSYDPTVDAQVDAGRLPLAKLGARLAEAAVRFYQEDQASILIPENSILLWDNHRMLHARSEYRDTRRHLTRYWLGAAR